MGSKGIDFTGKIFGAWTVLYKGEKTPGGAYRWWCRCQCGKEELKCIQNLTRGAALRCRDCRPYGINSPYWQGVGEISAGWYYNHVVRSRSQRGSRQKEVTVTLEYLWDLFIEQDRKCIFTGWELHFPKNSKAENKNDWTASLDRIDSSIGYIPGNVQWVHKEVNLLKNTRSNQRLIELSTAIALHCAGGACLI